MIWTAGIKRRIEKNFRDLNTVISVDLLSIKSEKDSVITSVTFFLHGNNVFAEESKILPDIDLIYQTNYVEPSNHLLD